MKTLTTFALDGILWVCFYSIFTENEYALYAANFIIAFVSFTVIFMLLFFAAVNVDGIDGVAAKFGDKTKTSKFMSIYHIASTLIEGGIIASLGFVVTGGVYAISGAMLWGLKRNIEDQWDKQDEAINKPA